MLEMMNGAQILTEIKERFEKNIKRTKRCRFTLKTNLKLFIESSTRNRRSVT